MEKDKELSHINEEGQAQMVDVGDKPATERWAKSRAEVRLSAEGLAKVQQAEVQASSFRTVVETAGMMAAKRTSELIPHCHPLPLTHIDVAMTIEKENSKLIVEATVRTRAQTGVEMEAMTAVSVAALTIYDMVKAVDPAAEIGSIRLIEKHGGSSGDLVLEDAS
ncbi:MAG: cyclic pyranopterin monophosphate synthase MoaC [Anaerolineales bacterium]